MSKKQQWEYRVAYTTNDFKNLRGIGSFQDYLNGFGLEGWEICSVVEKGFRNDPFTTCSYNIYMKRPLTKITT